MMMFLYILFSIQVLFGIFVIYLITCLILYRRIPAINKQYDSISIVIPFCNEAQNLPGLLHSLAKQNYNGLYEILLINDQSTDDYHSPIVTFKKNHPDIPLVIIDSVFDKTVNLTSKQQTIETGIKQASHDWIAFTDADMHLDNNWLATLNATKDISTSLVYGHTTMKTKKHSLFEKLQSFQLEFLFITAYAFFTAKLRGSCMGNNMLVSKKMYQEIGGQSGIGYSIVEDRDMLAAALKKGYKVTPTIPFYPSAETLPCKTIGQFFHQMLRWLKGGISNSTSLVPIIALLGLQNTIFLLSILGILPYSLLLTGIANAALLMIFSHVGLNKVGSKENILLFPLYYGFMIVETIIMVLPVLIITPRWKKRSL